MRKGGAGTSAWTGSAKPREVANSACALAHSHRHTCMCTNTLRCTRACTQTHAHTDRFTHRHEHTLSQSHTRMCTETLMNTSTLTQTRAHTHSCAHRHSQALRHAHRDTHSPTRARAHRRTHRRTRTHSQAHMHISHSHIHTRAHTRTRSDTPSRIAPVRLLSTAAAGGAHGWAACPAARSRQVCTRSPGTLGLPESAPRQRHIIAALFAEGSRKRKKKTSRNEPIAGGGRGLCGELAASPRLSEATLHFRPPALCPGRRGCGGTGPSQVCPARGPTQASPVGPKVWFFAKIFGLLRRGHPLSSTLSPGQVSFPKHQGPFSPPKKPGRTELSHRPFQSCACEAQLRGTFKVAGLRFVNLVYDTSTKIPNSKDTSLLKEKGHRT